MNKAILCAALAGVISAATAQAMQAPDPAKEKCYGIAKAGKNDCASADGAHSCAGHAAKDNDPVEWMWVESGQCAELKGSLEAPKK